MGKLLDAREKAEKILSECDATTKDALYRAVWFERVCADIRTYENNEMDLDRPLTDEEVEYAATRYVYNGKYDCTLSYWSNIEGVINMALHDSKM